MIRVAIMLIVAVALCAAKDGSGFSWENLSSLRTGDTIRVDNGKQKVSGQLVAVTAEQITVQARDGETRFARSDVRRVHTRSASHRLRNTLIGLGVGAAVGAVLYGTIGQLFRNEGATTGGFLGLPMAAGTAVGAALPARGWKKVYDSSP